MDVLRSESSGESVSLESIGGIVRVDDVYREGLEDAARA